jgi:5-methyltetrahydrofolate--homocysteine methyltransferase
MAELSDIPNEFIRDQIEEFIEREDEKRHIINLYSKCSERMIELAAAIIEGDDELVDEMTRSALDDGISALEVMDNGLIAGMAIVGIKFRENFIFVPEVLVCALSMKEGMAHIEPILSESGIEPAGKILMGTVRGDLHDIGKNLCIMLLRGAGFEVIDLGVDTSPEEFIAGVKEYDTSVVGMSALLTTTMPNMGRTVDAFVEAGMRNDIKFMMGGAPVTPEFASDMGADAYGDNAMECVDKAKQLTAAS